MHLHSTTAHPADHPPHPTRISSALLALFFKAQRPYQNSRPLRQGRSHLRLDGPSEGASQPLKQTERCPTCSSLQLGLYPAISPALESYTSSDRNRFAPACHLVAQHSLHTSLSIPAHPTSVPGSWPYLRDNPDLDRIQSMEWYANVLCLVGCLQCRRCILQTQSIRRGRPK